MAKERSGLDIRRQLLVYPVTDGLMSYPSMRENAEGYLLTEAALKWFWGHYLGNSGNEKEPLASPIYADDLSGLPPALVMTAEFDPLRDEGEAYAKRLEQAGVAVTHHSIRRPDPRLLRHVRRLRRHRHRHSGSSRFSPCLVATSTTYGARKWSMEHQDLGCQDLKRNSRSSSSSTR